MIPELRLGARLATSLTPGGRRRAAMTIVASAVGVAVILSILGLAAADRAANPERYADPGMGRVVGLIVAVIALQVTALIATAGRLSAALRARRLANLRLLGLSSARTRVVAATEAGLAAFAGALAGALASVVARPALGQLEVAGQRWEVSDIAPGAQATVLVMMGVSLATVALAALPDRLGTRAALAATRHSNGRPPSCLRVVPLAGGLGICTLVRSRGWGEEQIPVMLTGVVLTGLGVVLVVPVFVRLAASMLVRVGAGRASLVAGRRLQAQPSSVNRLITGLLLGLFLVTGARCVVVGFESTTQYRGAARQIEIEQTATGSIAPAELDTTLSRLRELSGVHSVVALPSLTQPCNDGPPEEAGIPCLPGLVASCAQVATAFPSATGCRDGQVMFLVEDDGPSAPSQSTLTMTGASGAADAATLTVTLPYAGGEIRSTTVSPVAFVVPPDAPGVRAIVDAGTTHWFEVRADPGRDLGERLTELGVSASTPWSASDYDYVAMMRAMVLGIGLVIIALGLLAFAIAAIDRATTRRADAVALQLIGAPGALLRKAQWIESALPIVAGTALAITSGMLAGAAFLSYDQLPIPWEAVGLLTVVAAIGGTVVAGLTVVAANPPISPETIRRT